MKFKGLILKKNCIALLNTIISIQKVTSTNSLYVRKITYYLPLLHSLEYCTIISSIYYIWSIIQWVLTVIRINSL